MLGKSYLLNQLSNEFAVIPEPLAIWESIYLDECNLIELMYLDPEKYGVVFEVIISRINVSLFNTVLDYCDKNIILFERSIFLRGKLLTINFNFAAISLLINMNHIK